MCYRRYKLPGRRHNAYGLFASAPEHYACLLEDPRGQGRSFLVSRAGTSYALPADASAQQCSEFMARWREDERAAAREGGNPCIRSLWYAAYEACTLIEECLPEPKSVPGGLLLWRHVPTFSLCFETDGTVHVWAQDAAEADRLIREIQRAPVELPSSDEQTEGLQSKSISEAGDRDYADMVRQVRAYIAAGDVFQANIARFWYVSMDEPALLPLYAKLRRCNPAPFAGWLRIPQAPGGALTLLSASPERLFCVGRDGHVATRPIAGTRRRADKGERDAALREELLLSDKERAEHIMLVDLERNDLGRVCIPGTVRVDECMTIEQYATVQHIVSNVRGRLRPEVDLVDVFQAMFPGGTITGCPKVRCMEIIHELEPQGRGPYTGGIGYAAWDGSADMNILIRTFWHHRGALQWAAGAGIVADSDPERERRETEHKAAGLLRALLPQGVGG